MKKTIAAILLLLWIAQCTLPYLACGLGRALCHIENLSSRANKKVVVFTFSSTKQINWQITNQELLLAGKLYDVVDIQHLNHQITVRCIADEHENNLVKIYTHIQKEKSKRQINNIFKKTASVKYIQECKPLSNCFTYFALVSGQELLVLSDAFVQINSPPPERVC